MSRDIKAIHQRPFSPLRCQVIELKNISDSLISFLLGINLPKMSLSFICFFYDHAQLLIVIRLTINCDKAVQFTRIWFFGRNESPKTSALFFGTCVVQVCWFAWIFLISNNTSEIFLYKLGVHLCVWEKRKQGDTKGGLVSFINPEISIKFAKSEASCVTVNQHKKYLLCGSNFLKHTALWQSPYESFWHIIIHLLKDHFVYKNDHIHTANFRFYGTLIFKSM